MHLPGLASVPSGQSAAFTDQLRLAVAAYPQTKELSGGFTVVDVPTREAALERAAEIAVALRAVRDRPSEGGHGELVEDRLIGTGRQARNDLDTGGAAEEP